MKASGTGLVIVCLATAVHVDWHLARPATHHLSLGWSWHGALAIPVFALAAFFVARSGPARPVVVSAAVVGAAALLGGILEPAWEYWLGGASYDWAFGPARTKAALSFLTIGLIAYVAAYRLTRTPSASSDGK
jgi:hypothetical protein